MSRWAFLLVLFIPWPSLAAVLINEVAWMGTATSANDEWIELYNSGETISLDGWVLEDNATLRIELSGTLSSGSYALLERTDDDSAPGTAFLIYTGALANEGRTLTLRRADGSIAEQVAGGGDWQNIGGDNISKDTAQRTAGGWITAAATPGFVNHSEPSPATEEEVSTTSRDDDDDIDGEYISMSLPETELQLLIVGSDDVLVHQPVTFTAQASGIGDTLIDSLEYQWNFGDFSTGSGKEVEYQFTHPGEYVVVLTAEYARHKSVSTKVVSVLPRQLKLSRTKDGHVQVVNNAPYDVDISGYRLVGDSVMVLPPQSIVLPRGVITVSKKRLENDIQKMIALYDTENHVVAQHLPNVQKVPDRQVPHITNRTTQNPVTTIQDNAKRKLTVESQPVKASTSVISIVDAPSRLGSAQSITGVPQTLDGTQLGYMALIGLLVLALLALYTRRI